MFEIIFLGTSASAPSIRRGLSAQIVKHDEYRFLVDCGEGTQRQILQSGLGFKRLNRVLLTHGHLDHILGLGGLLSTLMRWEALEELEVYGGRHTLDRVHDLLYGVVLRGKKPQTKLHLREVEPGVIFEAKDFSVTAFPVDHRGPGCFGYKFEEKSHRPFLADKADSLGVPFGPVRRDLVKGESITLENGTCIAPDDVLGPLLEGTSLAITGDTGKTNNLLEVCRGLDTLVIESTYIDEDAQMARKFGHLTARQAAELAKQAGVKRLILTHLSRRYRERDVIREARAIFPNSYVARDFDTYTIKREEKEQGDQ
ncbi:MAG: ribonuclease Z [Anaerolineae bacterium]|nr:ribonuclease Z [Anaerolineae bacterium]MBT4310449.1 ribonuclease Z [Anaerolineae bacterium]MBT4458785.1 ribonuclease Z [Anaerolineae bacterium]MBT4842205.1 ribonuclease Z [Anaerolineae bacterium]MBT6062917.1 ribonuclease Z [Anaerolineae bacterium]